MIKYTLLSASLAIALGGCASYAAPNDHLATSMASLRAAQEVGAEKNPQAALHVRLAQEEVNRARQLMADGDNERADYETMRANADAQLAVILMRESAAKARAEEATARLQQVGSQTMVTSGTQTVAPPTTPAPVITPSPATVPPSAPSTAPSSTLPSATMPIPTSKTTPPPSAKPPAPAPTTTH